MKIIDLSVTLENDKSWAPKHMVNRIKYHSHKLTAFFIRILYGLSPKYLRDGLCWANEQISLSTHGTTHVDAPWHYAPTSEGKPARSIDELPLDWFYHDGVVIDMRHKQHGEAISKQEVQDYLKKINYNLKPMDIVLILTGNDKMLGQQEYFDHGAGVSKEATEWLIDQGIKVMGIDSWGWDIPLKLQAQKAKLEKRYDLFWEAHFVGKDKEYCHMERLTNLDKLPPFGFKICCFPLKIKRASAGPSRVVAIME